MMRIETYTQIQQTYKTKGTEKSLKANGKSNSDQLQISSIGKDIQVAKQAVSNAPDIRESLVAPIRTNVQNGTYQVDPDNFAQKVIDKYEQQGIF